MESNDKKKNIIIAFLLLIIISLILLISKITIFNKLDLNKTQSDQTTTTTIISNKNSIFNLDYSNGIYGDSIRYKDISNYKSMSILPIGEKLKIFDTKSINEVIENDYLVLYLTIKAGLITDNSNNSTLCDLRDTDYISYKYFDDGVLFYGYIVNDNVVDLYECKVVAKKDVNRKLLYTFNLNEYDKDLYGLDNRVLLKSKNNNYYSIYDNMMIPDSNNIIDIYEKIMITQKGNVYFDLSKLIGDFDLKSIYYIESNCSLPFTMLITSVDNRLILSKYGADYKVYDQLKDIYFVGDYNNELYLEFLNGKTEKLIFDC